MKALQHAGYKEGLAANPIRDIQVLAGLGEDVTIMLDAPLSKTRNIQIENFRITRKNVGDIILE